MRTHLRRTPRIAVAILMTLFLMLGASGLTGYLDHRAFEFEKPTVDRRGDIAAVYWTGDMGKHVGMGRDIIDLMRANGVPVLTASSPVLFGRQRNAAYADRKMEESLRMALTESGAKQLAIVASSFGSDMVVASLGHVEPRLRRKVVSVVLIGPGTKIYFHANPLGFFYHGASAVSPANSVALLQGLPVTCIFGTGDEDSLCRERLMALARRVAINDGHMMLHSHALVAAAVLDAVMHPPRPMGTPR